MKKSSLLNKRDPTNDKAKNLRNPWENVEKQKKKTQLEYIQG